MSKLTDVSLFPVLPEAASTAVRLIPDHTRLAEVNRAIESALKRTVPLNTLPPLSQLFAVMHTLMYALDSTRWGAEMIKTNPENVKTLARAIITGHQKRHRWAGFGSANDVLKSTSYRLILDNFLDFYRDLKMYSPINLQSEESFITAPRPPTSIVAPGVTTTPPVSGGSSTISPYSAQSTAKNGGNTILGKLIGQKKTHHHAKGSGTGKTTPITSMIDPSASTTFVPPISPIALNAPIHVAPAGSAAASTIAPESESLDALIPLSSQ
jgi:hypothetical protein